MLLKLKHMNSYTTKELADIAAAVAVGTAGTSILADIDHIVSIMAGLAAICAAAVSIYLNFRKEKNEE